ncbi:MAG: DegT/DnrJ/EryC1/StrS family aminotransferase [Spirochaetota bacterium]
MNPSIDDRIPFHRPSIGDEEEAAVIRVLRSGWLTTAGEARAFEQEFASAVGARHAISVNSATSGLHLALEAAGVRSGGRVITTPYTFTSSAEVIRYLGADPLFVDVCDDDLNIDPALVAMAVEQTGDEAPQAILPVHLGGHACAMDALSDVARSAPALSGGEHAIPIIEDAAHAFPGSYAGRSLGTLGTCGVYSFYATKTITTGEGGMVVTDNDRLAARMGVMRLHGIDREVWDRYTSARPSWQYQVVEAGFKYNMPDILAAIGRVQLAKAERFLAERRAIAGHYRRLLGDRDYLTLPPAREGSSWHLFVLRLERSRLSIDRDEFIARLAERGIGTSVHYIPLHLMPYYRDRYGLKPQDFPVSLDAYERALSLPIYPGLDEEAVARVAEAVIEIGDGALTGNHG